MSETKLLQTCILAGQIMLENGAEMTRVEDTMNRIAQSHQKKVGISFVTPTIILMGLEDSDQIQMKRINERLTNLGKVAEVNHLSRQFSSGQLSLDTLSQELKDLAQRIDFRPAWLKVLAASILSASLMILLGGEWHDFIATLIVGASGYTTFLFSQRFIKLRFLDEFLASLMIGVVAFLLVNYGYATTLDDLIIGSVMPLVPGVAITNTVRDLQEGHMLAGISKGIEALIIALMLGAGIVVAFAIMR